jgi:hypothetical protein
MVADLHRCLTAIMPQPHVHGLLGVGFGERMVAPSRYSVIRHQPSVDAQTAE